MIYAEEVRDLFSVPEDYYLAHCISADFGMGKGIVVQFNKKFNMKYKLRKKYPNYLSEWNNNRCEGDCIIEGCVLNLITKKMYFDKPTYQSLKAALTVMKTICYKETITKIAMPVIGCGLDKLSWDKVSEIIKEVFSDSDIEILVCKQ